MRTTFLCLAVLFLVPHVDAAPAPAPGRAAKEKLETLKKRLPDLVSDWVKKKENDSRRLLAIQGLPGHFMCKPELRVLRRVGPDSAKAVILFAVVDDMGARAPYNDVLLTVFLTYHDGCWTTERFEATSRHLDRRPFHSTFAFLMVDIDEAAEK